MKQEFIGTDASLEISLFEYGFIARYDNKEREWFIVYRDEHETFSTGWKSEQELNDLIEGKEWMDDEKISSFLSFVGSNKEEWLTLSFPHKLGDLLNYWGCMEIIGTAHYLGMTEEEVREKYLN